MIGIDLVVDAELARRLQSSPFENRVFHPSERTQSLRRRASIFALKEACMKASKEKLSWLDITIKHTRSGRPTIAVSTHRIKNLIFEGSVSHTAGLTIAIVLSQRPLH